MSAPPPTDDAMRMPREALDRQHGIIEFRLEGFALKVHSGADQAAILDAMRDMLVDMSMHFGYEESLMDVGGYPDIDHHRRQHLAMMTELGLLLDRIENTAKLDNSLMRSVDFLAKMYLRHVAVGDQTLYAWLDGGIAS